MKLISILFAAVVLGTGSPAPAQDAAVEERLNKLSGHIEMLLAAKAEQDKRIASLAKEIETLREQSSKPSVAYANAEDLRKLAEAVKEIDQKRIEDNEKILKQIENIGKAAASGGRNDTRPPGKKREATSAGGGKAGASASAAGGEPGYEHEIAAGDTLSTIAEAFRAKGVKVTVEDLLKANPGLKERSLKVGQKIFIPAP